MNFGRSCGENKFNKRENISKSSFNLFVWSMQIHSGKRVMEHWSGYTCIMNIDRNRRRESLEWSLTVKIYGILSMLLGSWLEERKMLHFRMLFKFIYIFFIFHENHSFRCIITFSLLNLLSHFSSSKMFSFLYQHETIAWWNLRLLNS